MSESRVVSGFKPSVAEPEGGLGPLRHFRGVLKKFETTERTFQAQEGRAARVSKSVTHDFDQVEVLESVEPFVWKTAKITIPYSTGNNTRWAGFAAGARKVAGGVFDYDLLLNKPQEWQCVEMDLRLPKEGGGPNDFETRKELGWTIVSLAGGPLVVPANGNNANVGGISEYLASLADGKTEDQFNQAAMGDQKVLQAGAQLVTELTERQTVGKLITLGLVTKDDTVSPAVLHKVATS